MPRNQVSPLKMNFTLKIRTNQKRNLEILPSILLLSLICDLEWTNEPRCELLIP
jgi:hypothetical protein